MKPMTEILNPDCAQLITSEMGGGVREFLRFNSDAVIIYEITDNGHGSDNISGLRLRGDELAIVEQFYQEHKKI